MSEPAPVRARAGDWVAGARPRTLPAAVVPVLLGTVVAWWAWRHQLPVSSCIAARSAPQPWRPHDPVWWRAAAALVGALALQIGTNFANDLSDGVRGTDADRVGPTRLVAAGLASPAAVRLAALGSFAVAGIAGLLLAATVSWWVVAVGAACFAAGWGYTGGPRPYGYLGLGELFVFVFFGLVATVGSAYVVVGTFPALGWVLGSASGLLACALLEANNIRDLDSDAAAGKRTLAVRSGRRGAGWLYTMWVVGAGVAVVAAAVVWDPWVALALVAAPLAVAPVRTALGPAIGSDVVVVLGASGRLQIVVGGLAAIGVVVGAVWR